MNRKIKSSLIFDVVQILILPMVLRLLLIQRIVFIMNYSPRNLNSFALRLDFYTTHENFDKSKQWTMSINASDATNPVITVKSPANAFIGRYKVAIYLESTIDGKTEYALDEEPDIILLCNPWCEDDSGTLLKFNRYISYAFH